MKIVPFVGSAILATLSITSIALGGGLAGGGGPPSRELLDSMLQTQSGRAAVFVWDDDHYGLGLDQSLMPAMLVTSTTPSPETVTLAPSDYRQLEPKDHHVNAINRQGTTRSYRVLDGTKNGTLLLVDRRLLMRAGVRP
jgi:hypothetical protein